VHRDVRSQTQDLIRVSVYLNGFAVSVTIQSGYVASPILKAHSPMDVRDPVETSGNCAIGQLGLQSLNGDTDEGS
jgi:hypothetical protein